MYNNNVYIISGGQGFGKTTMLKFIISELQSKGVKVGGFIAEGTWMDGIRDGFSLLRIIDNYSIPLCQSKPKKGYFNLGRFWFNPDAIKIGEETLNYGMTKDVDIVVIDEIGIFELQEKIWYNSFLKLLNERKMPVLITVREKIIKEVIEKFQLKNVIIFKSGEDTNICAETIMDSLLK